MASGCNAPHMNTASTTRHTARLPQDKTRSSTPNAHTPPPSPAQPKPRLQTQARPTHVRHAPGAQHRREAARPRRPMPPAPKDPTPKRAPRRHQEPRLPASPTASIPPTTKRPVRFHPVSSAMRSPPPIRPRHGPGPAPQQQRASRNASKTAAIQRSIRYRQRAEAAESTPRSLPRIHGLTPSASPHAPHLHARPTYPSTP